MQFFLIFFQKVGDMYT